MYKHNRQADISIDGVNSLVLYRVSSTKGIIAELVTLYRCCMGSPPTCDHWTPKRYVLSYNHIKEWL